MQVKNKKKNMKPVTHDLHTQEDIYQQASVYLRLRFDCWGLIYSLTRPKLPVRCTIFSISPTAYKLLCWGERKYTETCSPALSPDSGADICEALVSFQSVVQCVWEMTTLQPTKVGFSHPKTKQWLTPDVASLAHAQGWSKRHGG